MARSMSFADPYELLAALGLYVRERVKLATRSQGDLPDMEYLRRGAHDVLVRTKICKVNHEDFTVSRTDITPYETLSPMGT